MFSLEVELLIASAFCGIIAAMIGWIMRRIISRIEALEQRMDHKVDRDEVRNLVLDRLDPLKERLVMLEHKIDQLLTLVINGNRPD